MDLKYEEVVPQRDPEDEPHTIRLLRIVPGCCEAAKKSRAIVLRHKGSDLYNLDLGQVGIKPVWQLRTASDHHDWAFLKPDHRHEDPEYPKFCPFCATPLPDPVPRQEPLGPVCLVNDGGYYCATCNKRLNACTCWPPEAAWEVP